jgi:hypothetical protein
MGMYIKSNSSKTIHNVLIARLRTLVYATSNTYPPSFNNFPPCAASANPFSFNDASAHPVKMLRSFHVDSPCRTSTSLCENSSDVDVDVVDVVIDVVEGLPRRLLVEATWTAGTGETNPVVVVDAPTIAVRTTRRRDGDDGVMVAFWG